MKNIMLFVKKYWKLLILFVGAAVTFLLFRKQSTGFTERLHEIQNTHAEEIKKIDAIREKERKQYEENEKRFRSTLEAIQKQYDAAKIDLDAKKKKEIKTIVKEYGDDPMELAKQLSESTGFAVVLPDP